MCQVYQHPISKVDRNTIYAATFFAFFLAISLGMTLYDHFVVDSEMKSKEIRMKIYNDEVNLFSSSRSMADHVLFEEERCISTKLEAGGQ